MKETRIYNTKLDINTQHTMEFYDERARRLEKMDCPYTAVLLGDQNPNMAEQWNKFEKQFILPSLALSSNSKVLDIGCGMGRWAETVIPMAGYYYGADFSAEMIKVAEKRCQFPGRSYKFQTASFQELVKNPKQYFNCNFDKVIVTGVCMYINDYDMDDCFRGLLEILDEHCTLYLKETVGVENRLTLEEHPSAALKAKYDVIYRTAKEYLEYYQIFMDNGFKIKTQDYLPHLNKGKEYCETERWYTILER